eukprot:TRINITY_DN26328_c0_g1_i1.p1 TRINITY_DN26328_c0_g1~~TRINITY_DN26328_c0_g1_i1.p1  ORF type:complete len:690 (-),score=180.19 TRINITY_DN26328_c0_g1_i1:127-2196(-)
MGCGAGHAAYFEGDELSSSQLLLGGEWHVEETPGDWQPLGAEISVKFLLAWYCGETEFEYTTDDGGTFRVDLPNCRQRNLATGEEQRVGYLESGYGEDDEAAAGQDAKKREGVWVEYDDSQEAIFSAWHEGHTIVYYEAYGDTYKIDFEKMVQTNISTGDQQKFGLVGYVEDEEQDVLNGFAGENAEIWLEYTDLESGKVYYHNGHASSWEPPEGATIKRACEEELWIEHRDPETGQAYYSWGETTTWDRPSGVTIMTAEEAAAAAAAGAGAKQSAVEDARSTPAAGEWYELTDPESGKVYYTDGQSTTWDRPNGVAIRGIAGGNQRGADAGATSKQGAEEWTEIIDPESGKAYYHNGHTTTWERPTGPRVMIVSGGAAATAEPLRRPSKKFSLNQSARAEALPRVAGSALHAAAQAAQAAPSRPPPTASLRGVVRGQGTRPPAPRTPHVPTVPDMRAPPTNGYRTGPQPTPEADASSAQAARQGAPQHQQQPPPQGSTQTQQNAPQQQGRGAAKPKPRPAMPQGPQKKWTLGPQQRTRLAGKSAGKGAPAGEPAGAAADTQGGAQQPSGGAGRASPGPGPHRPQPGSRPGETPRRPTAPGAGPRLPKAPAAVALPPGTAWPADPKARKVAEALMADMSSSHSAPLATRQKAFKAACLSWHPDKNPKHVALATEVFKFLQTLKSWYFQG